MDKIEKLLKKLRKAVAILRSTPGRHGYLLDLENAQELAVVGDLHGNLANFIAIIQQTALDKHPDRHLVVQELIHGSFQYDNQSDKSHQLLDLLATLICQFPGRVHFLLGNHEVAEWTGRNVAKGESTCNELFWAGIETAYSSHAKTIYEQYVALIQSGVLGIRTSNRVFLSHSIPTRSSLETFSFSVLQQWKLPKSEMDKGGSIYNLLWGRDASEDTAKTFLQLVHADWLITGHLQCREGFATPNSRQLVLESSDASGCYCLLPLNVPVNLDIITNAVRPIY